MKNKLIIALVILLGLSVQPALAQDDMRYLFGGADQQVSVSGFAGIFNEFSAIDKEFAFSMGGGAAMLLNRKFFIGAYGIGLTTRHIRSFSRFDAIDEANIYSGDLYTRFGHGGFWLGYIHKPENAIHWGADVKVGWGGITLNTLRYPKADYDVKWQNYATDNVFVLNPEVTLGMNLLKWMRVNAGIGYRFVTGVDKTYRTIQDGEIIERAYFEKNAFSNITGNITLAFGWFNK